MKNKYIADILLELMYIHLCITYIFLFKNVVRSYMLSRIFSHQYFNVAVVYYALLNEPGPFYIMFWSPYVAMFKQKLLF